MSSDHVDLTALEADDALIARVAAAHEPEQLDTELERLLASWRAVCRPTAPARGRMPSDTSEC